jgi:hypothetical protein
LHAAGLLRLGHMEATLQLIHLVAISRMQGVPAAAPARQRIDKMSGEVVDSNPYSRLMALQRMGIVRDYEQIRNKTVSACAFPCSHAWCRLSGEGEAGGGGACSRHRLAGGLRKGLRHSAQARRAVDDALPFSRC